MLRIENNGEKKIIPKNDSMKNNLIKYLYSKINLLQYTYKLLKYEPDLNDLLLDKYFVSANFFGTNCFLIFFTLNNKYYSFLVDKKNLKYSIKDLKDEDVNIESVKIKIDNIIYSGTIFDGIYIKKNKKNKTDVFVITDVYLFKGSDCDMDMKIKMKIVTEFLSNNYRPQKEDTTVISINLLYEIKTIRNLIDTIIPSLDYSVRGLCFYPNKSGRKIIYLFPEGSKNIVYKQNYSVRQENFTNEIKLKNDINNNISKKNIINKKVNDESSEEEDQFKKIYFPKKNIKKFIFEMKKDNNPDIYHLYIIEPIDNKENNKIKLKRIYVDIAYIPNIKTSKLCNDLFNDVDGDSLLVECKFVEEYFKWIPLRLSKNKYPSYIEDFKIVEKNINELV